MLYHTGHGRDTMQALHVGIVLVVGLSLVCYVSGGTFTTITEPMEVHGKLVFFCEYKGLRLLPSSKFSDLDDCILCKCDKDGALNCYDLGGRIYGYDKSTSKCVDVKIGCENRWVLKHDSTKKCPKKHIPPHGAVGK